MRDRSSPEDAYHALLRRARCERTVDSDGASTVWRIWEGGAGPVPRDSLLLLHGSFGSWTHWVRTIDGLSDRFRVVAVDTPGFGSSDEIRAGNSVWGIGSHLALGWMQLQSRLDGGGRADEHGNTAGRLWVAGFSLGAVHAGAIVRQLQLAGAATSEIVTTPAPVPVRVAGLILLAPGGLGARTIAVPEVSRIPPDLRAPAHLEARKVYHRRNLAATMFGDPSCIDDLALRLQDANLAQARLRGPFIDRPDVLLDILSALSPGHPPVLAIWGDRDAFDVDVRLRAHALCQVCPQADVVIVPGAGHWVGYETPALVNLAMARWINSKST